MDSNLKSNNESNVFNNREINELYYEIEDLFESLSKNLVTQNYNNKNNKFESDYYEENSLQNDPLKNLLIEREREKKNLLLCSAKLEEAKALLDSSEPTQKVGRNGVAWEIDEISLARLNLKWGVEKQQNAIRARLGQLDQLSVSDYYKINKQTTFNNVNNVNNSNNSYNNLSNNNRVNGNVVNNLINNNNRIINSLNTTANNGVNGNNNLVYIRGNIKFNKPNNPKLDANVGINNNYHHNNHNNNVNNNLTVSNSTNNGIKEKIKSEKEEENKNGDEENYYKFESYDDLLRYQNDEYFNDSMGPLPNIYYADSSRNDQQQHSSSLPVVDKNKNEKSNEENKSGAKEKKGRRKECKHYYYYKICNNKPASSVEQGVNNAGSDNLEKIKSEGKKEENASGDEENRRSEHRKNCRKRHRKKCVHNLNKLMSCGLQPQTDDTNLENNLENNYEKMKSDLSEETRSGDGEKRGSKLNTLYKTRVIYPNK